MTGRSASALLLLTTILSLCDLSVGLPAWVTQDMKDMVAADKARCMAEHGTTEALIQEVDAGKLVNDRAITCYMNCLFETFGVVDEDTGDFEAEMLIGFFPEDIQKMGREFLMPCAEEKGADRCDTMYKIAACVIDRKPEMWFML